MNADREPACAGRRSYNDDRAGNLSHVGPLQAVADLTGDTVGERPLTEGSSLGGLDRCGFVNQHDGNVVTNWIAEMAGIADER